MPRDLLDVIEEALGLVAEELPAAMDQRSLEACREALKQARLWERRRLGLPTE